MPPAKARCFEERGSLGIILPQEVSMGDTQAVRAAQSLDGLAGSLRGRLVRATDQDYETARKVYNADIDRRPLAIAQCANVADVIRCVTFAREHGLAPAIRGGGHSVPGFGTCDGGL